MARLDVGLEIEQIEESESTSDLQETIFTEYGVPFEVRRCFRN